MTKLNSPPRGRTAKRGGPTAKSIRKQRAVSLCSCFAFCRMFTAAIIDFPVHLWNISKEDKITSRTLACVRSLWIMEAQAESAAVSLKAVWRLKGSCKSETNTKSGKLLNHRIVSTDFCRVHFVKESNKKNILARSKRLNCELWWGNVELLFKHVGV